MTDLDADPYAGLPPPRWIAVGDMASMPRGWYWAAFPGSWVFYAPERNAVLSIDSGNARWHELMSLTYWGPWTPPPDAAPGNPDARGTGT